MTLDLEKKPAFYEVPNAENDREVQFSFLPESGIDYDEEGMDIDARRSLVVEPIKSPCSKLSSQHLQDLQFLETWVSGKSKHTMRGYPNPFTFQCLTYSR